MAGEIDLTLCEPTACGDPWHGLTVAGLLYLDNGSFKSVTNTPDGGDCFIFRIPGLPVPALEPDDVATGKKWLNYAVISGKDRRLYGVNLGVNAWLYLDSGGVVWRAVASWVGSTVTVAMTNIRDTTQTGSGAATVSPGFSGGSRIVYGVVDVASDGRKVVVSFDQDTITRIAPAYVELRISGPGAAPVIEAVLLSESGHAGYESFVVSEDTYLKTFNNTALFSDPDPPYGSVQVPWQYSMTQSQLIANTLAPPPTSPGAPYTVFNESSTIFNSTVDSGTYQEDYVAGWIYDSQDALLKVVRRVTETYTAFTTELAKNFATGTWDPTSYSGTFRRTTNMTAGASAAPLILEQEGQGATVVTTIGNAALGFMAARYTNKVFGLTAYDSANAVFIHYNPVCPTSTITATFNGTEPACSFQPATNELHVVAGQLGPVCYI